MHLRNAPTRLMKELGYGKGSAASCLPEDLAGRKFLRAGDLDDDPDDSGDR